MKKTDLKEYKDRLLNLRARLRGDVELRTDDRLDLALAALQVELRRPEHVPVVRQGQGLHAVRHGLPHQALDRGRAVQQGEVRMRMEVDEVEHA